MSDAIVLHDIQPGEAYSLHHFGPGANHAFAVHSHRDFHELFLVAAGHVRHLVDGHESLLEAGSLVLVRRGDRHALHFINADYINLNLPANEWQRLSMYVGDALPLPALIAAEAPPCVRLNPAQVAALRGDLEFLFRCQRTPGSRTVLAPVLLRWLALLPVITAPIRPSWLDLLLTTIEEQLASGVTTGDLPRIAGISREHLARTFRQHLGTTPRDWLRDRRLARLELLLERSDRTIAYLAASLGFGSQSYLHRCFQARYGVTPEVWRRRRRALIAGGL